MLTQITTWLDDRLNPIMVKEVYQGYREKTFISGLSTILLLALLGYLIIAYSNDSYINNGKDFFNFLLVLTGLITLFSIPSSSANQLRNEISSNTLDLITITHLSAWTIISGRFQAAGIKVLLLFAYIGPFAIASFLLGGIGVSTILFRLILLLLAVALFSSFLLLSNTLSIFGHQYTLLSRGIQGVSTMLFAPMVLIVLVNVPDNVFTSVSFDTATIYFILYYLFLILVICFFHLRLAADLLQAKGIRSFYRSKITLLIALILSVIAIFASNVLLSSSLSYPLTHNNIRSLIMLALLVFYIFSLFWSSYVPQHRLTFSPMTRYFFSDGYFPTLRFVFVSTCTVILSSYFLSHNSNDLWVGVFFFSQFCFFTGIAYFLRALGRSPHSAIIYQLWLLGLFIITVMISIIVFSFNHHASKLPSIIHVFMPLSIIDTTRYILQAQVWNFIPLFLGLAFAFLGKGIIYNKNKKRKK